ncbi:MAG: Rid family hydrolase [Nocardioides sp.]|uniref:Rid family hydrolase n=1 Tax=Nocardioides sp. TaxID=35761 RepID=UPI0039E41BEE
MSESIVPAFAVTPGYGEEGFANYHMVQAVRIGQRVEVSGQTGRRGDGTFPADVDEEIATTFVNIGHTLASVGASWSEVYSITSYHVPDERDGGGLLYSNTLMVEQMRLHMPDRKPLWTCIGVKNLGIPAMRVEIVVVAHVED